MKELRKRLLFCFNNIKLRRIVIIGVIHEYKVFKCNFVNNKNNNRMAVFKEAFRQVRVQCVANLHLNYPEDQTNGNNST